MCWELQGSNINYTFIFSYFYLFFLQFRSGYTAISYLTKMKKEKPLNHIMISVYHAFMRSQRWSISKEQSVHSIWPFVIEVFPTSGIAAICSSQRQEMDSFADLSMEHVISLFSSLSENKLSHHEFSPSSDGGVVEKGLRGI